MASKISKSIKRVDGPAKISGRATYINDMRFDKQVYARTVRSEKSKAKILSVNIPNLPEGYFIIDKDDVPGVNRMRTVVSDHPIFADGEVNYIGQPILLVVGPSQAQVDKICSTIKIEYAEKTPIRTIRDAEKNGDVFTDYTFKKGDSEDAFTHAAHIITDEYSTGLQEHIYLEPQGMIGVYEENRITVYGSMQCPFFVEGAVQDALGWDSDRIRIIQTTTGGAFGGKEEFPSLLACQVAVASLKAQCPVRLIYDRSEDILCSTKRHPSIIRYKAGLNEADHIIALEIDILFDAGAYSELSQVVLQRGMFSATSVYDIPNLKVRGRTFKTNTVPSGAFRGFGAPQTIFATEMLLHNIAQNLGIDPLDFKMKHLLRQGATSSTGGLLRDEIKMPEIIDKIEEVSGYRQKTATRKNFHGIGISLFQHGCGFTGRGETDIRGKVILQKNKDRVTIKVSSVEMGQGAETCLRKIVAHTLDLPLDKVRCESIDTTLIPDSGPTVASRTTMIVGGLLQRASWELKERWHEQENIEIAKVYEHPDFLEWDDDNFRGDAYPAYSWGANVAEVSIDPVTYEITVEKIYGVYDVGVAIDERALRGQMQGGILQGIGYATTEKMDAENGILVQNNLIDYKIPSTMDVPEIDCHFIENPYEFGPFGAKCAGELPFVGAAPAIAAAVADALDVPVKKIPLTPEYLMELMHDAD